jgi:hypothetical protein
MLILQVYMVEVSQAQSHHFPITEFVTRVARRMPHVEQELKTLPEHMSSPLVLSGVLVSRYLAL